MGSGASTLDKAQRELITEKLRLFYDVMVSEGKSEVELNELMITKYNELLQLLPNETDIKIDSTIISDDDFKSGTVVDVVNAKIPTKATVSVLKSKFEPKNEASSTKKNSLDKRKTLDQSPLKKTDINKGPSAYPSTARQQGASRRRSFANEPSSGGEKSNNLVRERLPSISEDGASPLKSLITSSSAAGVIETDKDSKAADSWESVVLQPSCTLCGMFFLTEAKKERHIKYSDLHAKNVRLQQPQKVTIPVNIADDLSRQDSNMSDVDGGDASQNNIGGELIYSGSKFFWRTRDDVDVHIYLHVRARALEVIPYDLHTGREMERIYLSKGILLSMIGHEALERKMEELKLKRNEQQDKTEEAVATANRDEEAKRLALSSHILSRLQITSIAGAKGVLFEPSASDDTSINPILKPPVSLLTPVQITRRRRTTAAEVISTLDNLAKANRALQAATGKAEKLLRK